MEVRLVVRGDRACFRRPEFAHDLISYDVITPIAASGILERLYRRPGLRWAIDEIRMLQPIRFTWMALAEAEAGDPGAPLPVRMAGPADRRIACVLSDVGYVLTAHAEGVIRHNGDAQVDSSAGVEPSVRSPFLGLRRFPAEVELLDPEAPAPPSAYAGSGAIDLGWMLFDTGYDGGGMRLYRPTMVDGVIDLRRRDSLILAG